MNNNRYANLLNPLHDLNNLHLGGALSSFVTKGFAGRSSTSDFSSQNFTQMANLQVLKIIESLVENDEYKDDIDLIKQLSMLRHRDILRETLLEL